METVLVIGSTGNIGISAVLSTLRTGRLVLAVVRNESSAEKFFKAVSTRDGLSIAVSDAMSETGVQKVVAEVVTGALPAFQHVYTCAGGYYVPTPVLDLTTESLQEAFLVNTYATFCKTMFAQDSMTINEVIMLGAY